MKRILAILLVLSMALAMAACTPADNTTAGKDMPTGSQSQPTDHQPTDPQPTEPQPTVPAPDNTIVDYYLSSANEVTVTEDAVSFTDDSGREQLTIRKNPENVAVLFASLACLWYEAGGTSPLLIGGKSAVTLYKEQIGRDITQDEGVHVVSESSTASEWDVEAIIANEPGLIVCSAGGKKGYDVIAPVAEAAGIPVIAIEYNSVQDYLKWFKVFCNLSGHPEKWDEIASATAEQIIDIVSRVPAEAEHPKVAILIVVSGKLRAYGTQSAPGTIMAELGGINALDDGTDPFSARDVDLEQLYAANPDLILISDRSTPEKTAQQLNDVVGENPVWQALAAVKKGVIYLEKGLFHNKPNRRYQEAYLTMAKLLYPAVFE